MFALTVMNLSLFVTPVGSVITSTIQITVLSAHCNAQLRLPDDLTNDEADRLAKYIKSLVIPTLEINP